MCTSESTCREFTIVFCNWYFVAAARLILSKENKKNTATSLLSSRKGCLAALHRQDAHLLDVPFATLLLCLPNTPAVHTSTYTSMMSGKEKRNDTHFSPGSRPVCSVRKEAAAGLPHPEPPALRLSRSSRLPLYGSHVGEPSHTAHTSSLSGERCTTQTKMSEQGGGLGGAGRGGTKSVEMLCGAPMEPQNQPHHSSFRQRKRARERSRDSQRQRYKAWRSRRSTSF